MISNDEVEKAVDYLSRNAREAAQARADRIYMDEFKKVLKAQIMSEHNALAVNAREQYAYADPRYLKHLEAMRDAVFQDERHRFLREAASATLEAWRTQSATERAMKL